MKKTKKFVKVVEQEILFLCVGFFCLLASFISYYQGFETMLYTTLPINKIFINNAFCFGFGLIFLLLGLAFTIGYFILREVYYEERND